MKLGKGIYIYSGVLVKSIGAVFTTECPSNSYKYYALVETNSCTNLCAQFLHKTATLIYVVNRSLVAFYDIPG